ncbi:hypothetical protein ACIQWA_40595 [Kitasatospora sp. NPDC098652]|uniref:hypothetical protein n=1 Tax=Kitasatospora sp. NPDC098652 TaxID=3364095 RepID=UPI003816AC18
MVELPEEAQVAALRRLAELGAKRAELLSKAEELLKEIEPAAIEAVRTGAGRNRIRELSGVSPGLFYGWLETAGIEVRTKKAPAKKATPK